MTVIAIMFGCGDSVEKKHSVIDFPNTVDISGIPQNKHDLKPFGFSDMGAWHGYSLPPKDSTQYNGSFVGPLSMKMYGEWISKSLVKLKITDNNSGKLIDLSKGKVENNYYPGFLEQKIEIDKLVVTMRMFFVSSRTSVQYTTIKNNSKDDKNLKIGWTGRLLSSKSSFVKTKNGFKVIISPKHEDYFRIKFNEFNGNIDFSNGNSYLYTDKIVVLKKGLEYSTTSSQSHYFSIQEEATDKTNIAISLSEPKRYLKATNMRWEEYINSWFKNAKTGISEDEKRTAVKAIQTLTTNWRSPAGDLKHDGVFPSAAYHGFYGFWSWDSWKHVVSLVKFNPELAKSSMWSMFDYQDKYGMIADCIYYNSKENNWRDTKAPLAAWAVWEVYKQTKDKNFVIDMYPLLVKYHKWWYMHRDVDKNGLCEYGSTDGSIIAAKWESGMDNAVRFDSAKMVKTNDVAWSMNQESVDLNSYLYDEKLYLSNLASAIDKVSESEKYKSEAAKLKSRIQNEMFDKETGFFYDIDLNSKKMIKIKGPEGWIPLWTGVATKEQAELVKKAMMDEKEFNCKIPCPTLTSAHPKFNPLKGYWRGPVWLDQFYFGVKGLERYGYNDESKLLIQKLFKNGEGVIGTAPIRENYHPVTGKGLNANHFSWSSAHILMMLE